MGIQFGSLETINVTVRLRGVFPKASAELPDAEQLTGGRNSTHRGLARIVPRVVRKV